MRPGNIPPPTFPGQPPAFVPPQGAPQYAAPPFHPGMHPTQMPLPPGNPGMPFVPGMAPPPFISGMLNVYAYSSDVYVLDVSIFIIIQHLLVPFFALLRVGPLLWLQ